MDFLKKIIEETGNEYASIVADGVTAGDIESFIDTGSHSLNALLSGSIYNGLPSNKITAIAGESATGKTFFVLGMVKHFLDANPNGGVLYFEGQGKKITAEWINNNKLKIVHDSTINFTMKRTESSYYTDDVEVEYCAE